MSCGAEQARRACSAPHDVFCCEENALRAFSSQQPELFARPGRASPQRESENSESLPACHYGREQAPEALTGCIVLCKKCASRISCTALYNYCAAKPRDSTARGQRL